MSIPRPVAYLLILFLMACYVAGYAYSAPHTDTADEILRAYEIRHGLAFPAEGPFLGNALHLGPAWFYLAAIALWISHTWLSVVLFIGLVASLKFPLAYFCGRRMLDSDFGLLWAVAMFVPGWNSFEQLAVLNPNAIAAALLAVLALFLRGLFGRTSVRLFFVLGLAFALAIHVHPTSLPAAALVLALLWIHRRRGQSPGPAIAAAAAGFAIPFLPYVASQLANGFADWKSASSYAAGQISLANIVNFPSVIVNYATQGPALIAQYFMGWQGDAAMALGIAFAALVVTPLAALAGTAQARPARRLLPWFVAALFVQAAWIACARPATPVQFAWILCPFFAALAALGLWALCRLRTGRGLAIVLVSATVLLNCLAIRAMAFAVREGEGRLPSRVLDIKGSLPPVEYVGVWFPAHAHGELGRLLCTAPGIVDLHGHLAEVVDKDLGLDSLLECGDRSRLSLAGDHGEVRYAGMTRGFWRALGRAPPCPIGSLGITTDATVLLRHEGLPVADGSTYLPRRHASRPSAQVAFTLSSPRNNALLVTNVLGAYEVFRVESAQANGMPAVALARNDLSQLYGPLDSSPEVASWRFEILTSNPDAIDIVAIGPAGSTGCATYNRGR